MDKTIFCIASLLRIILSYNFVYNTNLAPFIKAFGMNIIDWIDCGALKLLKLYQNNNFCQTEFYQKGDKITDLVSYTFLLMYINQNKLLEKTNLALINFLFVYRLIGVISYLNTNNRNMLYYFPNYFLEISMILLFIQYKNIDCKHGVMLVILVIIFKLIQEECLHKIGRA